MDTVIRSEWRDRYSLNGSPTTYSNDVIVETMQESRALLIKTCWIKDCCDPVPSIISLPNRNECPVHSILHMNLLEE